jgi:hypothetical protein
MKIREIILEAPQQMPNFGTAGQQYNVNYKLGGVKTPAKGSAPTKSKAPAKGTAPKVDLKTRPFDLLNQNFPEKVPKVKGEAAKAIKGLAAKGIYKVLKGTTLLTPLIIWVDDMSAINEMWESGYFNSYGNKAGEVAQQMRTAHTQLLFSRYATILPAWWLGVKTSSIGIRLAMGLIPGIGWVATLSSLAAGLAVTAMLQTDFVQKFIVTVIIDNIPYLGDAVYETAKVVGAGGTAVPAYLNQLKKKFTGATADAVDKNTPQSVKSAASAVGNAANTAGTAAKGFTDRVGITKTEPLGSISDLAKDL